MTTAQTLYQTLLQLDRQSYKAYKSIRGRYQFADFLLLIDSVQGDPFAAPSRVRVQMPQARAGFPPELYQSSSREIALRDYLTRQFDRIARQERDQRGSGNSGLIAIAPPSQQVLDRTALWIDSDQVEVRFVVGLPAAGRRILGRQAAELLCENLPSIVAQTLDYEALDSEAIWHHLATVEDADWLRQQLDRQGLVAFIPDGAILPRCSGVEELPLLDAVPFRSPASLRVEFDRPNYGKISGMGVPQGVTLIVGGGYHGKSTLLEAIALGVYNHVPHDGREQVVTVSTAMKIRAEDGRSIVGVDISPFINHLPQDQSTVQFSSQNASGSTSQAANIIEALEAGAKLLLVDEDTAATNLMIRDRRMQALIAKDQEPITPLIDKVRQLYQDYGVSTLLVMGGSGDYFEVADTVIAMTQFQPIEVTAAARKIAQRYPNDRTPEGSSHFGAITNRILFPQRWDASQDCLIQDLPIPDRHNREEPSDRSGRSPRLKVRDLDQLVFGHEVIDLAAIDQLVEVNQLRAIGAAITYLQSNLQSNLQSTLQSKTSGASLHDLLTAVMRQIAIDSLDCLTPYPQGDLALFRSLELAAAINRLRGLKVRSTTADLTSD